jgi:predicted nucleic acid-binding protein
MSRIFWDTNPYIYLFEAHPQFEAPTRALRQRMLQRKDTLLTSAMTLAEVQVKPLRSGNTALAQRLRDLVRQSSDVLPFNESAADIFARLRLNQSIRPADAMQLSTAAAARVELFITNDSSLHKLTVPGIHFICSIDRAPI